MAAPTAADQIRMNAANRSLVIQRGVPMLQRIYAETITNYVAGTAMSRNIPIKNVGLSRRLYVKVNASVTVGAAETQTKTVFGPANIFSNVTFADYSNYQRINTTGWHLHMLATAKNKAVFGSSVTTDTPTGFGSTISIIDSPVSYTAPDTVQMIYEVPFAYSNDDLTGAVLSNIINANAYLAFTINPNFFVTSTANETQAVFQSSTAQLGVLSSITVEIYQDYIDQLPMDAARNMLLPALDLSNVYGIYNTQILGLAANSDNPVNYTNYRRFLSTIAVYDNAGVLNAGTDINLFKLQAANMTNIFELPPSMISLLATNKIMDQFPLGSYYFDHRAKPIDTMVNGNMQLLFNPSVVTNSTSQLLIGFEYIALLNQVAQAGSIIQ